MPAKSFIIYNPRGDLSCSRSKMSLPYMHPFISVPSPAAPSAWNALSLSPETLSNPPGHGKQLLLGRLRRSPQPAVTFPSAEAPQCSPQPLLAPPRMTLKPTALRERLSPKDRLVHSTSDKTVAG